jgi:hypothetical protein
VVAPAEVHGLQDVEIVLIDDVAFRISRGELNVGDHRILRIARIDLSTGNADDHLVLAYTGERISTECHDARENCDLGRACVRNGRCGYPSPNGRKSNCRSHQDAVRTFSRKFPLHGVSSHIFCCSRQLKPMSRHARWDEMCLI